MVEVRFINDTTPIEVTSDEQVTEIQVGGLSHGDLNGRDYPDQHPITAITGLQEALDTIPTDYVSDAELESALLEKQDTLTAGANIQIVGDTISATDTTYTAGTGISIVGNVISNIQTSAEWGNINGSLSAQTDLQNALNAKANVADIPTATSDLLNDSGFITLSALTGYATQTWVENQNYITGDYIGDAVLTIQRNNTNIDTFTANAKVNKTINIAVPTTAAEVNALSDSTKYGYSIDLSLNTTDYKLTLTLKDQDGTILNSKTVDFPIESVVVNGTYDSINKKIVLTLQNGNTIDIPVGDLIAGLQTEITSENKLDADLVDDSTSTSKFVTSNEKNTWNSKQDTISDLATIRSGASAGATAVQPSDLATVATSGSYDDLSNKPTIPAAQVNSDWNATSGVAQILNKPTIPTVPTNVSAFTNDAGYITSSALSGYATETWVGQQGYITGITSSDVTTALGYIPYNSSNPSGYTSNVGTVVSVNNTSPDSGGNVTISIPAAQVNSDWNATSGVAQILNKPSLATVATTGAYSDLSGTPSIPTVNNATLTITQGGVSKGTFTANASSDVTIALDAGGGGSSYTAGTGIDITNGVISVDGVTTSEVTLATVATTGAYSDLTGTSGVQVTSNLVTSVSSSSTDTQYPSAKCVYDIVGDVETLINAL